MRLKSTVDHFYNQKGEKKRVDTRKKYDVTLKEVRGEPSDINWENLNLSMGQRMMRGCIASSVVSLFLLVSIVGTAVAQTFQLKLRSEMSGCELVLSD